MHSDGQNQITIRFNRDLDRIGDPIQTLQDSSQIVCDSIQHQLPHQLSFCQTYILRSLSIVTRTLVCHYVRNFWMFTMTSMATVHVTLLNQ